MGGLGTRLGVMCIQHNLQNVSTGAVVCLYPDPPPKRKGGSGEYSTAPHQGLAIAVDSAKS